MGRPIGCGDRVYRSSRPNLLLKNGVVLRGVCHLPPSPTTAGVQVLPNGRFAFVCFLGWSGALVFVRIVWVWRVQCSLNVSLFPEEISGSFRLSESV